MERVRQQEHEHEQEPSDTMDTGRKAPTGSWSDPVAPFEVGLKTLHLFVLLVVSLTVLFSIFATGAFWQSRVSRSLFLQMRDACLEQTSPSSGIGTRSGWFTGPGSGSGPGEAASLSFEAACQQILSIFPAVSPSSPSSSNPTHGNGAWHEPTVFSWIMRLERLLRAPLAFSLAIISDAFMQLAPFYAVMTFQNQVYVVMTNVITSSYPEPRPWFFFAVYEYTIYALLAARLYGFTHTGKFLGIGRYSKLARWLFNSLVHYTLGIADATTMVGGSGEAGAAGESRLGLPIPNVIGDALLLATFNVKAVQWLDDYIQIPESASLTICTVGIAAWYAAHAFTVCSLADGRAALDAILAYPLRLPNWLFQGHMHLDVAELPLLTLSAMFVAFVVVSGVWRRVELVERRRGSRLVESAGWQWLHPNSD